MQKNSAYQELIEAVKSALPQSLLESGKDIGLHEPEFLGNENKYVKDCIDTGWVSSVGKYVDEFENKISSICGVKKAVAIVNGTSALHLGLEMIGVEPGDEVLAPALTFVATANAIAYCKATPHFIECSEETLGADPVKCRIYLQKITQQTKNGCINKITGKKIKALVIMHTYGHPVDLDEFVAISNEFNIPLVEDAAESLGSTYKNKPAGSFGSFSILSFNGNKIVTTGGGGALLTQNEDFGMHAKYLSTTAKIPHAWNFVHNEIGYNYRLPNINAAMGCAQLEQLSEKLKVKRGLAEKYIAALTGIKGVRFVKEPANTKSNYWLNTILLDENAEGHLDSVIQHFHDSKIKVRPAWKLMSELPMYKDCPSMELNVSKKLTNRIINLPSSTFLNKN